MNYATVDMMGAVQAALAKSKVRRRINTSFLERQNAAD